MIYSTWIKSQFVINSAGSLWLCSQFLRGLGIYSYHGMCRSLYSYNNNNNFYQKKKTTTSIWPFLYVQCLYLNGIKFMLIFFCRVPMYGELKLALFIYLWYPKTKVKKKCKSNSRNHNFIYHNVCVWIMKQFLCIM